MDPPLMTCLGSKGLAMWSSILQGRGMAIKLRMVFLKHLAQKVIVSCLGEKSALLLWTTVHLSVHRQHGVLPVIPVALTGE